MIGLTGKGKLFWLLGLPLILSVVGAFLLFTFQTCELPQIVCDHAWFFFMALVAFLSIMLWQIFLLIDVLCSPNENKSFYKTLAKKRILPENKEYVESYRHLREHANAFEIIFLEIVLVAITILFPTYALPILAVWILPSAFCWIIGTMLEKRMDE